ncbi:MAG: DUF6370 family protein [Acidobacteriota bacterium]|nr:DUF6370 family protein [Acidobacteriota bacterium]
MKKHIFVFASVFVLLVGTGLVMGAGHEKTIKGEGTCAKCGLGETASCQNAIQVKKDGKTVTYYMVANDVAKKFHGNVCQGSTKVKAKGTVAKEGGKMMLTASSISKVAQ